MYPCTWMAVVAVSLWSTRVDCTVADLASTVSTDQAKARIAQLEAEKSDLLQQIQDVLSDDLVAKEVMAGLNISQSLLEDRNEKDGRRADRPMHFEVKKRHRDNIFDVDSIYSNQDKKSKKWGDRMKNKGDIQAKLDKWMADREAEKVKIKKYKEKIYKTKNVKEVCPREGFKKKKGMRRSGTKESKDSRGHKYPCCRKCCKRSYMGCL